MNSRLEHRGVKELQISLYGDRAVTIYLQEALQHLVSGHSYIMQGEPPIVFADEAHFRTHISRLDAWKVLMGIPVSYLDDKRSDSIVICGSVIYDNQPGKDQGVIRVSAHFSRPPFSRGDRWHVDHELVSLLIEGCRGLKTRNVRAMPQLGLRVASENVLLLGHRDPLLSLFIIAKLLDGLREHRQVHPDHGLTLMLPDPTGVNSAAVLEVEFAVMIEPKMVELFHPHFLLLLNCPLIVFVSQHQLRVVLDIMPGLISYLLSFLPCKKQALQLALIKITILSLNDKFGRRNLVFHTA